jgi:periplasmic divalent cation tolerance protein
MDKPIPPIDTRCHVVLTTLPSREAAQTIARTLIDERLAACVQLVDGLQSIYRWDGRIAESAECQLTAKTTADAWLDTEVRPR